ncbi:MAG TPA: hypothetical protein VKA74_04240 [Myxococcota bacterium]|nr:hypothetical protein [Myxococcota bacterium]
MLWLALGLCSISGCAQLEDPLGGSIGAWNGSVAAAGSPEMTEAELHSELAEFSARFGSVMGTLGERIPADESSARTRRNILVLRVQLVPLVQQHALDRDPRAGFVSLLSLTVMLRRQVEHPRDGSAREGQASLDFGSHQSVVEKAIRSLENDLLSLGRRFLDEDRLSRLHHEVEAFAREKRPGKGFAVAQVEESLIEAETSNRFSRILDLPLAPFRALSGVEQGPAAIREFTQTARGFAAIVSTLPLQLRWQADLLIHETLQRGAIDEMITAVERATAGADAIRGTVARLPEEIRRSLISAEDPLRVLNESLDRARALAGPLESAAAEVARAGAAWSRLVHDGSDESPESADEETRARPSEGVRVARRAREVEGAGEESGPKLEDWTRLVDRIGRAASRLEAASRSVQRLIDRGEGASAGDPAALEKLDRRLQGLVDHVVSRALLLLAGILALSLLYRFLSSRLAGRRDA